jgi:hypothetical protein
MRCAAAVVLVSSWACAPAYSAPDPIAAIPHPASSQANATPPLPAPRCEPPLPTYLSDVRPILERRCNRCHTGDGPAAEEHDWSRIETLRGQRRSVADDVTAHAMPPSGATPLSGAEVAVVATWALCGAAD